MYHIATTWWNLSPNWYCNLSREYVIYFIFDYQHTSNIPFYPIFKSITISKPRQDIRLDITFQASSKPRMLHFLPHCNIFYLPGCEWATSYSCQLRALNYYICQHATMIPKWWEHRYESPRKDTPLMATCYTWGFQFVERRSNEQRLWQDREGRSDEMRYK